MPSEAQTVRRVWAVGLGRLPINSDESQAAITQVTVSPLGNKPQRLVGGNGRNNIRQIQRAGIPTNTAINIY